MALFTDTVTIYNKQSDGSYNNTVIHGVQWSDKCVKENNLGRLSLAKYATVTFPQGTYENLVLDAANVEDAIFYGVVEDEISDVKGQRLSDLMKQHSKSGLIQQVNDNSNRDRLKNIKVVVA